MTALELIRSQAWSVVLIIAIIVSIVTYVNLKLKGGAGYRISWSLVRGIIFYALFYIPLIEQPRILSNMALPITGIVFLLFGVILVVIGSKQLTKTDLHGIKGIPEEIITKGLYSIIRHPVNLGLMFTFAGWYIVWSGVYSLYFLAVFIIVFVIETFWEERNLEKAFGDRYTEYKKKVGMFFPKIRMKE